MNFPAACLSLLKGKDWSEDESFRIFKRIFLGKIPEAQAKALVLLLAKKGESPSELLGCLKALRTLEKPVSLKVSGVMDTCGTGGDQSGSLNISTLAALVIAGAGGKVAKHGNRGFSSPCGSSDLMESFGINLRTSPKKMFGALTKIGMGYFHAPLYHPVFSKVQSLRRGLKVRTIFNLLGPLSNPVQLSAQLIGVSSPQVFKLYAEVLRRLKNPAKVLLCHSVDGMDEMTTSSDTEMAWIEEGKVEFFRLNSSTLGLPVSKRSDLVGGSIATNHRISLCLLQGQTSGKRHLKNVILLNAAAGLWILGKAKSLREGIALAQASLDKGKAYQILCLLKKITK